MTPVVLERPGQVPLVAGMHPSRRHRRIHHLLEQDRLRALLRRQVLHDHVGEPDPLVEVATAGQRAGVDGVRLRAEEDRADRHPSLHDEAVHRAVVPEQLPAPGRDEVRLSIQGEVVAELVEDRAEVDQLPEEAVDHHHPVRDLENFGAQRLAHQLQRRRTYGFRLELQPQPRVELHELRIRPGLPLDRVDRMADPSPRVLAQQGQQVIGR